MDQILEENSTAKYFVQFEEYKFNHVAHGIISLGLLGANKERMKKFAEMYNTRLDRADEHVDQYTEADVGDLVGKHESYYCLVAHYEQLLQAQYGGDLDQLVGEQFTKLSLGLIGDALHGLIHVGYGHAARSARVVCEGLAFLHFSHVPLTLSTRQPASTFLGQGTKSAVEVITKLRDDDDIYQFMMDSVDQTSDEWITTQGPFAARVNPLMTQRGDVLSHYVRQLKFSGNFNFKTKEGVKLLAKWALDCAVVVYTAAETKNDFFLLHGVTGAWALYHIIDTLTDFDAALDAVHTFLCALLAAYLAVGRPPLHMEYLAPKCDVTWSDLVEKTLTSERDVHVYKLVQVCRDMSGVDGQTDNTYRLAAHSAISHALHHRFNREMNDASP